MAAREELDLDDLKAAPIGTTVLDWERDMLVKEAEDAWFYAYQPLRGNVPRPFDSEVLVNAYGPIRLYDRGTD